jgi:hypothetical protein
MLELGEDLFDWVEIGGVFRQQDQSGPDLADDRSNVAAFKLSAMTTSPKRSPLIGASIRSTRGAAMKVMVFHNDPTAPGWSA